MQGGRPLYISGWVWLPVRWEQYSHCVRDNSSDWVLCIAVPVGPESAVLVALGVIVAMLCKKYTVVLPVGAVIGIYLCC